MNVLPSLFPRRLMVTSAAVMWLLAGCSFGSSTISFVIPTPTKESSMIAGTTPTTIPEATEVKYGEELLYSAYVGGQIITQEDTLRIGVGDVRYGEYVNEKGQSQSGRIATVAIFVRDHPELERSMEVYEGQTLTVTEHRIRVTDVDVDLQLLVLKIATQIE